MNLTPPDDQLQQKHYCICDEQSTLDRLVECALQWHTDGDGDALMAIRRKFKFLDRRCVFCRIVDRVC